VSYKITDYRNDLANKGKLIRPRVILAGREQPSTDVLFPWGKRFDDLLARHAQGRADATAEVMVGLAYLKASGLVSSHAVVDHSGAVYQAVTSTRDYPYAHRMPCNPILNIWSLPDLVHEHASPLRRMLIQPLAEGDIVPLVVNYADGHFERKGAPETVDRAVQFIIHEQDAGKPVNTKLIRHVIDFIVSPGYADAYQHAIDTTSEMTDDMVEGLFGGQSITSPTFDFELTNQRSIASAMASDPRRRPTDDLETAKQTLESYTQIHRSYKPMLAIDERISQYADQLASGDAEAKQG